MAYCGRVSGVGRGLAPGQGRRPAQAAVAGTLRLGLIFNILNFENGKGEFTLSAYWQSVIRGAFLLLVVLLQNRLARRPS